MFPEDLFPDVWSCISFSSENKRNLSGPVVTGATVTAFFLNQTKRFQMAGSLHRSSATLVSDRLGVEDDQAESN